MKYITKFETTAAFETAESTLATPNVSLTQDNMSVHYKPFVPETRVVVYYDIQNTSSPTTVCTNYDYSFKSMEIDGKDSVDITTQGDITYQFDSAGEHVIKYELNGLGVGTNAPLFYNLSTVKRVIIPNMFTSISGSAFYNCTSLTSIYIPSSITSIGDAAFSGCDSLASIVIPNSVTSIGGHAFYNCTSLTSITVKATMPPTLDTRTGVFDNTNDCPIYVPSGSVDAYKAASGWSAYASRIQAIP